jgi:hypothetical protein
MTSKNGKMDGKVDILAKAINKVFEERMSATRDAVLNETDGVKKEKAIERSS